MLTSRTKDHSHERRRHPRTRMVTDVRIYIKGLVLHGTLVDISIGGLLAEAEIRILNDVFTDDVTVNEGEEITVDIPRLRLTRIGGHVIRVSSAGMGYVLAVQFEEINPEVAIRIIDKFARK